MCARSLARCARRAPPPGRVFPDLTRVWRRGILPFPMPPPAKPELKTVGKAERRVDSVKLATGRGTFVDDIALPGMLHARILHSPHAHARITRIDAANARAIPGVACVLTHLDVPRVAYTTAGQGWPEPSPYDTFMLDDKVRFVGDRVAVVAADDPELAQRACEAIKVDYEPLPAVFDPEEALRPGAPVIHD